MNYIGISCGYHDAALSVVDSSGNILFAGHSERYSGVKHDKELSPGLWQDALSAVDGPYQLHYYERPVLKYLRQLRAGERPGLRDLVNFKHFGRDRWHTHSHHLSHAAAGFQTSPFDRATVVVIDAIGEFDTVSIWGAEYVNGVARYKRLWRQTYPHSIGLFYTALTQRVGLKPLDEEYILMGMAAWGHPTAVTAIREHCIADVYDTVFSQNLHIGLDKELLSEYSNVEIAASAQVLVERLIGAVMNRAADYGYSNNLVYMGGVALNCTANRNLGKYFDNTWIMPNPGDAGSSLGAAALGYGRKLNWVDAYLGHNIPGPYPVHALVRNLVQHQIVGVASGRAEFGPRALGNRSLLADPRGNEIKDKVNEIKRRQKFRPFAPVIMEEHVHEYFDMPVGWSNSRYMQTIATCRDPSLFPAIVHVDNTSRVQTVPNDGSGIRRLLEAWYDQTGCPMLLNTSLNIRGEPMVNNRADADRFEQLYGITVCS